MAFRKSTTLKNAQADATGDFYNSGTIQLRTGGQPASANDAASGTLVATINLPVDAFNAAASGVITKLGTWSAVASGSGNVGWARFINSGATHNFDCTVAESGGDLTIDDADVVSGNVVTVTAFSLTIP